MEACLLIARQVAHAAASWTNEQLDAIEATRECCRTICYRVGYTDETECLAELWMILTMAKSKMSGFSGNDISLVSMGLPQTKLDLTELQKTNLYAKRALLADLKCLFKVLPLLENMCPALVWQVKVLAHDVEQLIA